MIISPDSTRAMYCWIVEKKGVVKKPAIQHVNFELLRERTGTSGIPVECGNRIKSHPTVTSRDVRQRKVIGRNPGHPVHELPSALSPK
jgi:hypothetical protein